MATYCDYEHFGYCQYGMPDRSNPEGVSECREPAIARVWWGNKDKNVLLACGEHLIFIIDSEEKAIASQDTIGEAR